MLGFRFIISLAALCYGINACTRHKQPLFFKIILYGVVSYFFGALFSASYMLVYRIQPAGFHVGYFGHVGMYFFLLSSYYGAMDRLADSGEKNFYIYRFSALAAPLVLGGLVLYSCLKAGLSSSLPLILFVLPMGLTLYFALKHLILPDVELGIIKVMRPYNACVILFCVAEVISQLPQLPQPVVNIALATASIVMLLLLPLAQKGVRQWFI